MKLIIAWRFVVVNRHKYTKFLEKGVLQTVEWLVICGIGDVKSILHIRIARM